MGDAGYREILCGVDAWEWTAEKRLNTISSHGDGRDEAKMLNHKSIVTLIELLDPARDL